MNPYFLLYVIMTLEAPVPLRMIGAPWGLSFAASVLIGPIVIAFYVGLQLLLSIS